MGLGDFLRRMLFGATGAEQAEQPARPGGLDENELARRLDLPLAWLLEFRPTYHTFSIPKRSGGSRKIAAPSRDLKDLQRRILRRLLNRLTVHPCATGFQKGHSIVTNALVHTRQAVVLRMDLKEFFPSTGTKRIASLFRRIGWNGEATALLTRFCTHGGGLPQGAPTSPRLSNLVNRRMDARLAGLADKFGATYTRYADDITFSLPDYDRQTLMAVIRMTKWVVADEGGYKLHQRRKLHIRRRHDRQMVTGLVVNDGVDLPRRTRRWLRAVEHHLATGRDATLTPDQLRGWRGLRAMVDAQRPRRQETR